jgi:hypothetical protein
MKVLAEIRLRVPSGLCAFVTGFQTGFIRHKASNAERSIKTDIITPAPLNTHDSRLDTHDSGLSTHDCLSLLTFSPYI